MKEHGNLQKISGNTVYLDAIQNEESRKRHSKRRYEPPNLSTRVWGARYQVEASSGKHYGVDPVILNNNFKKNMINSFRYTSEMK